MQALSKNRLYSLLCLLALGGIILALAFESIQELYTTYRAQSWDETPCTVTHIALEKHTHTAGRRHRTRTESYSLIAHYTYKYNGLRRVGHRYDCGKTQHRKKDALRLKNALEQEPETTCYVNPDNPQEVVIDRSLNTDTAIVVGAGAGIYTLALLILLLQKNTPGKTNAPARPVRRVS